MTIENLIKVVPPPDIPSEAYCGSWEVIEAEIGTPLPQDYKDFVRLYGNGAFLDFLGVNVPRSRYRYLRLETDIPFISDGFAQLSDVPYPVWPAPGGVVPFGETDNGDTLFWLPRGAPETWVVVVNESRGPDWEVFECDLTDFLAGLVTGEIRPRALPDDLSDCDHVFIPQPDWRRPYDVRVRSGARGLR